MNGIQVSYTDEGLNIDLANCSVTDIFTEMFDQPSLLINKIGDCLIENNLAEPSEIFEATAHIFNNTKARIQEMFQNMSLDSFMLDITETSDAIH